MKALMDVSIARSTVLAVYLIAFSVCILLAVITAANAVKFNGTDYVQLVTSIYSVPLTIVFVGVLAPKPAGVAMDAAKAILLYFSTIIWNLFVLGLMAYFLFSITHATSTNSYVMPWDQLKSLLTLAKDQLAFLISGVLTYVYASSASTTTTTI